MTILVIAEHNNNELSLNTVKIITAAKILNKDLNTDINVLVAGFECQNVVENVQNINGVSRVLVANHQEYQHQLAENISLLATELASKYDFTHIISSSSNKGKELVPRIAALLDVAAISDVIEIHNCDTFTRPIYAGNALETIESSDPIKVLTIRATVFDAAENGGNAEIITIDKVFSATTRFISEKLTKSQRPDLNSAKIIVSGGRGLGNKENFALLEQLADKLGAAIGASRAAVDAGFISNDLQIGQTGKVVAPELYIALGISGAIQHIAGIKDAKIIVAINKDPDAPIFEIADYGLVADLFETVPELINSI